MKKFTILICTLITIAISLLPIAWLIMSALKPSEEIINYPYRMVPKNLTIENFHRVFSETSFLEGLITSLQVAVPVTIIVIALSTLAGYLTVRVPFRGRTLIEKSTLAAYTIPPILLALPLFILLSRLRLVNTLLALAFAHIAYLFPLAYWLTQARMHEIPVSLEETLWLEGGYMVDVMKYVWFPKLRLHLLSVSAIIFTISMNDYVLARFLLIGNKKTLPIVLQGIFDLSSKDWALICGSGALAVLCVTVPVLALLLATGKYYVGGARG